MIRYVFKDTVVIKNKANSDPQVIGETINSIRVAHGYIDPYLVRDHGRSPESPIHQNFTWEDAVAADAYRLDEARKLITCFREYNDETETKEESKPAYFSLGDEANPRAYRPVREVIRSRELQLLVLKQAERELRAFVKRYKELLDICNLVGEARDLLLSKIECLEDDGHKPNGDNGDGEPAYMS